MDDAGAGAGAGAAGAPDGDAPARPLPHDFHVMDAKAGLKSLNRESVQVVCCSPPYFNTRDYREKPAHSNHIGASVTDRDSRQLGHEKTNMEYVLRLADCFGDGHYLTRNGSLWIVIGDSFARRPEEGVRKGEQFDVSGRLIMAMVDRGWGLWQKIVWDKPSVPTTGTAQKRCNPSHEDILWFVRKGTTPLFNSRDVREKGTTPAGTMMPPMGGKKYGNYKKGIIADGLRCLRTVWRINPSRVKAGHVAPFPEEIPERIIKACSDEGHRICDPFFGTGTTADVAKRLGRSSVGFDIFDHNARKRKRGSEDEESAGAGAGAASAPAPEAVGEPAPPTSPKTKKARGA